MQQENKSTTKRPTLVVKRSLNIARIYRGWADYAVGDIVVGEIVGQHTSEEYGTVSPIVKVIEAFFKDGKGKDFVGKNLVLNSTAVFQNSMVDGELYNEETQKYVLGAVIQVEYQGEKANEKGKFKGKNSHQFQIDVMGEADEDTNSSDDLDL